MSSILIVGATGTLGRQIAKRAIDEGHSVRCLVRSYRRAAFLKEWGAELVGGDLLFPETLPPALDGMDAVIDAATSRPTDMAGVREVDWDGKVSLIRATIEAGIDRYIFFSPLQAADYPQVPLMEIKRCTEQFLAESGLNYTILQPSGFMQGIIPQYAIPILDNQSVWVTNKMAPIAYMDTQDIAKFAVRALELPETEKKAFPVVGTRAWSAEEIIALCERFGDRTAKVTRIPIWVLRAMRQFLLFFQWGRNAADRLSFAEVGASGQPISANMDETYNTFGFDPRETTSLESYLREYFSLILKKLKEIEYQKQKAKQKKKKRSPFKSDNS